MCWHVASTPIYLGYRGRESPRNPYIRRHLIRAARICRSRGLYTCTAIKLCSSRRVTRWIVKVCARERTCAAWVNAWERRVTRAREHLCFCHLQSIRRVLTRNRVQDMIKRDVYARTRVICYPHNVSVLFLQIANRCFLSSMLQSCNVWKNFNVVWLEIRTKN